MLRKVAAVFVIVFALSGCSSNDSSPGLEPSSPTSSSSGTYSTEPPSQPDCADIWKDGATLPKDYDGCRKEGAQQESVDCKDGTSLIVFDQAFFAVTGGTITRSTVAPLQDTEAYGKIYAVCTGE